MNNQQLYHPINASRKNPYDRFDRGLFVDDGRVKRIAQATWVCHGDTTAPGVLTYRVEVFTGSVTSEEDLVDRSEGLEPTTYTALTRGVCDKAIVVEAFAIKHYLSGKPPYTSDEISGIHHNARKTIHGPDAKNGFISLTTVVTFAASGTTPLTITSANTSYSANVENGGAVEVISGSVDLPFDEIRPVIAALNDIRVRASVTGD